MKQSKFFVFLLIMILIICGCNNTRKVSEEIIGKYYLTNSIEGIDDLKIEIQFFDPDRVILRKSNDEFAIAYTGTYIINTGVIDITYDENTDGPVSVAYEMDETEIKITEIKGHIIPYNYSYLPELIFKKYDKK